MTSSARRVRSTVRADLRGAFGLPGLVADVRGRFAELAEDEAWLRRFGLPAGQRHAPK